MYGDVIDLYHDDPEYLRSILKEIGIEETSKLKVIEATESKTPLPHSHVINIVLHLEDTTKLILDIIQGELSYDEAVIGQDLYLKILEMTDQPIAWKKEALLSFTSLMNVSSRVVKDRLLRRVHTICPKIKR